MARINKYRSGLIIFLIFLGVFLFYIGKEHQVFVDNKLSIIDGKTYQPIAKLKVSIGNGNILELATGDRDVALSRGPFLRIKVEIIDQNGETLKIIEKSVRIGFKNSVMVSLPALTEGSPNFILPSPNAGN